MHPWRSTWCPPNLPEWSPVWKHTVLTVRCLNCIIIIDKRSIPLKKSYLKNGNPCISNIVKVNSSFVWVYFPGQTLVVILVPVHTWPRIVSSESLLCPGLLRTQEAVSPAHTAARNIRTSKHPVLSVHWADERVVISAILLIVATQEGDVISPGEEEKNISYEFIRNTLITEGRLTEQHRARANTYCHIWYSWGYNILNICA